MYISIYYIILCYIISYCTIIYYVILYFITLFSFFKLFIFTLVICITPAYQKKPSKCLRRDVQGKLRSHHTSATAREGPSRVQRSERMPGPCEDSGRGPGMRGGCRLNLSTSSNLICQHLASG